MENGGDHGVSDYMATAKKRGAALEVRRIAWIRKNHDSAPRYRMGVELIVSIMSREELSKVESAFEMAGEHPTHVVLNPCCLLNHRK